MELVIHPERDAIAHPLDYSNLAVMCTTARGRDRCTCGYYMLWWWGVN